MWLLKKKKKGKKMCMEIHWKGSWVQFHRGWCGIRAELRVRGQSEVRLCSLWSHKSSRRRRVCAEVRTVNEEISSVGPRDCFFILFTRIVCPNEGWDEILQRDLTRTYVHTQYLGSMLNINQTLSQIRPFYADCTATFYAECTATYSFIFKGILWLLVPLSFVVKQQLETGGRLLVFPYSTG